MTTEYEQQIMNSAAPNGTILVHDLRVDARVLVKALRELCNKVAYNLDDLTNTDRLAAYILHPYLKEIFPIETDDKPKSNQ